MGSARSIAMLKIKASEDLFNHWVEVSYRVKMLSSIIQNDTEIDENQYWEWVKEYSAIKARMEKLFDFTVGYIEIENDL